jgi:hypothetical protein
MHIILVNTKLTSHYQSDVFFSRKNREIVNNLSEMFCIPMAVKSLTVLHKLHAVVLSINS